MTRALEMIRTWAEMVKFSHSIFALPFALMATFLAGRHLPTGVPAPGQLGLIVACMVAARSFAMTFNRIADAAIDARNPRTDRRPIPAGRISVAQAWTFLVASGIAFVASCGGFLWAYGNPWPLYLAAPTLAVLAAYSYTKRFTTAAHFVLGAAIALAPAAAWIAIDPATIGSTAVILTAAVLFWIAGFDIIYACQDVGPDRRERLFSLPAKLGIGRALTISRGCHIMTIALLVLLGRVGPFGWIYWIGVTATALLLAAEQAIVRADDLSRVNLAFFTLNGCVSLMLATAAVTDLLLLRSSH
ncbi:MAG: UbiA-like polyprenyltransferase [Phycisphaerae bacterium]